MELTPKEQAIVNEMRKCKENLNFLTKKIILYKINDLLKDIPDKFKAVVEAVRDYL